MQQQQQPNPQQQQQPDHEPQQQPFQQQPEHFRKLFIGGLDYSTTEEGLRTFYGQWGELTDCAVNKDVRSGKSRGSGFVIYADSSAVDEAMKRRPHSIDRRQVQPRRAVPKDEFNPAASTMSVSKIFVGGLRDKPIEKEDLEAYFGTFGSVREVLISTDKETGKSRGFGFVLFQDCDSVDKVVMQRYL